MGKTPGKWIKSLLLGKRSSKSNLKGRDILKSANREQSLITSKVPVSESPTAPPVILPPVPEIGTRNVVDSERGVDSVLPNTVINQSSGKDDGYAQAATNLGSQNDSVRIRHEQAATKAQAAFRGYLARRAFRTLKGIIRLQAVIRGHLVRRQAVATLHCLNGIVKFQALARGRKVRCSDIGIQIQKICTLETLQGANCSNLSGVNASTSLVKLSKNAFIRKLLSSLPTAKPLCLHHDPGELNSAWQWLERWTKSRFWELHSQSKRNTHSKSQTKCGNSQTIENEKGMSKRNVWKLSSSHLENSSSRSISEPEKLKRNPRKGSSHPVDSVHEHPQNDMEKVKRNLRKVPSSTKEVSERLEVDNEKPKRSLKKVSGAAVPDVSVQGIGDPADKATDIAVSVSKQSDADTTLKISEVDGLVDELLDHPATDLQPGSNGKIEDLQGTAKDSNSNDDQTSNENQKNSQRRASLPAKIDHQENGLHSSPKAPSYMAPTESAKAKLRGQGSPRFSQDVIDKNGTTRRHSLPSSKNGKLSSLSPRVPRLVHAAGKGAVKSDRSLSSSRDGGDKVIQAEWRR